MKYTILTFLIITAGFCQAQELKEANVPTVVKDAFKKKFPAATKVEWSKESETEFEAEFKNNNSEQSAIFSAAGVWTTTETVIDKAMLPQSVQASITKGFAGYKIDEVERVETGKSLFYEVELTKAKSKLAVQIAEDGKVIKQEEAKEEKD